MSKELAPTIPVKITNTKFLLTPVYSRKNKGFEVLEKQTGFAVTQPTMEKMGIKLDTLFSVNQPTANSALQNTARASRFDGSTTCRYRCFIHKCREALMCSIPDHPLLENKATYNKRTQHVAQSYSLRDQEKEVGIKPACIHCNFRGEAVRVKTSKTRST